MNKYRKKLISIVVPFYNEGACVDDFYRALVSVLESNRDFRFEIICVDDGSQDDTLDKLISLTKKDARVLVVELSRNFGKEAALTAGLETANGDAAVPIDCDLQDPPELISDLINEWKKGAEVVLARRIDRNSDSFFKRKTAEFFYKVHNCLSPIKIPHNVGDFRLMDRSVLQVLATLPEQQRFMKGLFAWIGFRTVIVDYARKPRGAGQTKFSGWKLWNFALEGITSFSAAPLKAWMYMGIIGAISTAIYAVFIISRTIFHGVDVPGYASILIAILFFGSLQLLSLGMLGEYIGRIYIESKRRPVYIVRRHYGNNQ